MTKVEIPREMKKDLRLRFTPKRTGLRCHEIVCPLCKRYRNCTDCPLDCRCGEFVDEIVNVNSRYPRLFEIGQKSATRWKKDSDHIARKQLAMFRREAAKKIRWV